MGVNFNKAEHHLRKAREHFGNVKDKELAEGLRRLCTGLLRMNDELRAAHCRKKKH